MHPVAPLNIIPGSTWTSCETIPGGTLWTSTILPRTLTTQKPEVARETFSIEKAAVCICQPSGQSSQIRKPDAVILHCSGLPLSIRAVSKSAPPSTKHRSISPGLAWCSRQSTIPLEMQYPVVAAFKVQSTRGETPPNHV